MACIPLVLYGTAACNGLGRIFGTDSSAAAYLHFILHLCGLSFFQGFLSAGVCLAMGQTIPSSRER